MIDVDKEKIVRTVFNQGWLKGLNHDEVTRLVSVSELQQYSDGDSIYQAGDSIDSIYFVIDGLVRMSIVDEQHDNFPVTIWEAGNCFGEGALQQPSTMPLTATSMSNTTLLAIPLSHIDTALDNSATFYKNVLSDVAERTQLLYKIIEILLFDTLKARVAARVLHLTKLFGEPVGDGILLPIEFNQADFAKMSGGSRQRVNKIFKDWSDQGILSKRDKLYILHQPSILAAELKFSQF